LNEPGFRRFAEVPVRVPLGDGGWLARSSRFTGKNVEATIRPMATNSTQTLVMMGTLPVEPDVARRVVGFLVTTLGLILPALTALNHLGSRW
jgi:hypothetical protein